MLLLVFTSVGSDAQLLSQESVDVTVVKEGGRSWMTGLGPGSTQEMKGTESFRHGLDTDTNNHHNTTHGVQLRINRYFRDIDEFIYSIIISK